MHVDVTHTDPSATRVPEQAPRAGATSQHPSVELEPVSGLIYQTMRDGWTFCKATSKALGRYQWVSWLGAAAAIISAVTATTIFATLNKSPSTAVRVIIGSVTVLTAAITALQAWASKQVKGLSDQHKHFHAFHREVQAAIEQRAKTPLPPDYADKIEKELASITAGMIPIGTWAWDRAKAEMEHDIRETSPHLSPSRG
ncbi:MAG: hypothetical protein QOG53_1855 [Frankiales bacterium]|nr:hypothetical protein [Frankiales bacterium]